MLGLARRRLETWGRRAAGNASLKEQPRAFDDGGDRCHREANTSAAAAPRRSGAPAPTPCHRERSVSTEAKIIHSWNFTPLHLKAMSAGDFDAQRITAPYRAAGGGRLRPARPVRALTAPPRGSGAPRMRTTTVCAIAVAERCRRVKGRARPHHRPPWHRRGYTPARARDDDLG
jgi:hypothetical protein